MNGLFAHVVGHARELAIDVELKVTDGPLVLVGPNGSGKTSILLMLLGALPVREGRVEVADAVLLDTAKRLHTPLEDRNLAYVPQDYALFPHMTVEGNIAFAVGCSWPVHNRVERIQSCLADLKLESLAARPAGSLSGGEKQRVALARALSVTPRALLLDEPLAALDISARRDVRSFLSGYLKRLSLPTVIVTHDPADARALGHEIAVIENGRVVQAGTWQALLAAPATPFVRDFVAEA